MSTRVRLPPVMYSARDHLQKSRRGRAGVSLSEIMIVMAILLVVVSIFSRMMVATSGLREVNRENAVAAEYARIVLERMRNVPFEDVYALYNADPTDDPDGVGTAPGHRFVVPDLRPLDEATGWIGEVVLPSAWVDVPIDPEDPESPLQAVLQMREDSDDEVLGLPRDLNGDSLIDAADHADDYVLLPIRIRLEWIGLHGPRRFEVLTLMGKLRS